jgi:DNA (cytosine-5)-methyltransferase 1
MGGGQREMGGERSKSSDGIETNGESRDVTNTNSGRQSSEEYGKEKSRRTTEKSISGNWKDFPSVSPICDGDDGLSNRLDNITFPKWRNESIKAGGNAIVPQVVYQIFKAIEEYELLNQ